MCSVLRCSWRSSARSEVAGGQRLAAMAECETSAGGSQQVTPLEVCSRGAQKPTAAVAALLDAVLAEEDADGVPAVGPGSACIAPSSGSTPA